MSVYKINNLGSLIRDNTYVGRGIVIGKSPDGKNAVVAYFIMGRSENSRNRVFVENEGGVMIQPFDISKVSDPSLIIYSPIKKFGSCLIVTNGDQTDTIHDFLSKGKSFEQALETRSFEPDEPNFTPRISGLVSFEKADITYKLSILKSADENGTSCSRCTFSYSALPGLGHFIHTYNHDGNPIPSFTGEPERVAIHNEIDKFTSELWENLNEDNRVSLYVRNINLATGREENRIINRNNIKG